MHNKCMGFYRNLATKRSVLMLIFQKIIKQNVKMVWNMKIEARVTRDNLPQILTRTVQLPLAERGQDLHLAYRPREKWTKILLSLKVLTSHNQSSCCICVLFIFIHHGASHFSSLFSYGCSHLCKLSGYSIP